MAAGWFFPRLARRAGARAARWASARSSSPAWSCPNAKLVSYYIDLKRVIMRRLVLGVADGIMKVDGKVIYEAKDLRVGLFTDQAQARARDRGWLRPERGFARPVHGRTKR